MALSGLKNTVHGLYKSTVEYVTPINKKSEFHEKGVLTPEEFIQAGCQLVYKCPTWSWESGDSSKKKTYLPDNQQYLISRNLPCLKRVQSLINSTAQNESIVEDGEWLNMENDDENKDNNNDTQEILDIDLDKENNKNTESTSKVEDTSSSQDNKPLIANVQEDYTPNVTATDTVNDEDKNKEQQNEDGDDDEDDFEEIVDIEDFNDTDNVISSSTQPQQDKDNKTKTEEETQQKSEEKEQAMFHVKEKADNSILKTRTYDISITYDKYYRVPRVWLRGFDENGNPLTSSQIFEDISADHAHKTVTVEQHAHTFDVCASIHPCRHSEVMKRFMTKFEESGKQVTVDQYLFLFLKFMSAVIPTIEYDYTQSVQSK